MMIRRCAALLAFLCAIPARAQVVSEAAPVPLGDAARADALNEEGKALYSERQDYAGAADRFRAAIQIAPDARYFYNLCVTLEKLERYRDALDACDEVFNHAPREDLATKTGQRAAQIRREYREQRAAEPPATQPVGSPPDTATQPPPPEEPGGEEPVETGPLPLEYRWGLGADLGAVANSGVGFDEYARGGLAVKLHGDLLLAPRVQIGVQAYLDLSLFDERAGVALSVIDLGLGVYWHRRLWRSLYITPLAGLHLTAIAADTAGATDTFGTLGFRAEGTVEWVFAGGRQSIHVTPISLNLYLPAGGSADPAAYGLDGGGVMWAFTVGYTIRFSGGPFPGLTLE